MRVYGSVPICFWANPDIQKISDQAKLLAIYLQTGPHSNMIGCFRLPDGYVTEDLQWDIATVKSAFQELSEIGFLIRDFDSNWLVIHDFLKSNPIQNPKQGIGIKKLFERVPESSIVYKPLIKSLFTYGKYLDDVFINCLYTIHLNSCSDQNNNQEQDNNQNQINISGKPDINQFDISSLEKYKTQQRLLKSQALEILNFLNEKTGKGFRDSDENLNLIMARLKSGATVMDCRQIIVRKHRDWKDDEKMKNYLRPATLFNAEKFEQYMGELVIPKEEEVNGIN